MVELRAKPKGRKEKLQRLIGDIRDKRFEYKPRQKPRREWARYDEAQSHELADVIALCNSLVDPLPEPVPNSGPGKPVTYRPKDLAKAVLVQTIFQKSNRVTSGFTRLFQPNLSLERPIHYKAIERAYATPSVVSLLLGVLDSINQVVEPTTTGYTLDGSGIPSTIKGNWERDKAHDKSAANRFDGAITLVALPSQIIVSFIQRQIGFSSEVDQLPLLVSKATASLPSGRLSGITSADAGFQSRANCETISTAGSTPRILPRRNVSLKTLGAPSWTRMLNDLLFDPQTWLEEYHLRSLAETSWSLYVWLFPRPVRRRAASRRAVEHVGRFVVFNLVRVSRCYRQGNLPTARRLIAPAPN